MRSAGVHPTRSWPKRLLWSCWPTGLQLRESEPHPSAEWQPHLRNGSRPPEWHAPSCLSGAHPRAHRRTGSPAQRRSIPATTSSSTVSRSPSGAASRATSPSPCSPASSGTTPATRSVTRARSRSPRTAPRRTARSAPSPTPSTRFSCSPFLRRSANSWSAPAQIDACTPTTWPRAPGEATGPAHHADTQGPAARGWGRRARPGGVSDRGAGADRAQPLVPHGRLSLGVLPSSPRPRRRRSCAVPGMVGRGQASGTGVQDTGVLYSLQTTLSVCCILLLTAREGKNTVSSARIERPRGPDGAKVLVR